MTKKLSTKQKILHTAISLFSQKGYSGVSVRDITGKVGIKESSLYNHFKSKEEILTTIFERFRSEFAKTLPSIEMLDEIIKNT